jgi:uncharacterized protein
MPAASRLQRIYVDSSVWIAVLAREAPASTLTDWLAEQDGQLLASYWTRTELASALGIKARRGELTQKQMSLLLQEFERWVTGGLQMLAVDGQDFAAAAALCEDVSSGLRAGDALHLSVARRCQASHLLSLDGDMIKSAPALGLAVVVWN